MAFKVLFFAVLFVLSSTSVSAERSTNTKRYSKLTQLVKAQKGVVGISVIDVASGATVFEFNADKALKPASVLKVITGGAVLERFASEYRFSTNVFTNSRDSEHIDVLYIRGGGDPTLTIESLWLLARRLYSQGYNSVNKVVLDAGAFSEHVARSGSRAYQSGSSALSFNFNSIAFVACPAKLGKRAKVRVDPWEAGAKISNDVETVAGSIREIGIDEQQGTLSFRVRGRMGIEAECARVYRSVPQPIEYLARVIKSVFTSAGVSISHSIQAGETAENATLLFAHESKPLKHIVEDLNLFSTNFIGEQLLFLLGLDETAPPEKPRFTREQGLKRMEQYVRNLGIQADGVKLVDGSGLSHDNRLSARVLTMVLLRISRDKKVRPEYEGSLSVSARRGTLKARTFGGVLVRGKTGTLNGVSSLAGYLVTNAGKDLAFSIIHNDVYSEVQAKAFQEKFVEQLAQE